MSMSFNVIFPPFLHEKLFYAKRLMNMKILQIKTDTVGLLTVDVILEYNVL